MINLEFTLHGQEWERGGYNIPLNAVAPLF